MHIKDRLEDEQDDNVEAFFIATLPATAQRFQGWMVLDSSQQQTSTMSRRITSTGCPNLNALIFWFLAEAENSGLRRSIRENDCV